MTAIYELHKKEKNRLILSSLVAFVCIFVTNCFFPLTFATNDDTRIMYAVAGYASGQPYPQQQFISLFLGWLMGGLYTLFPSVPWYAVYHLSMVFFALVMINKSVLKTYAIHNCSVIPALVLIAAIFGVFFLYPSFMLQFTTTAAICAVGSVAVMAVWCDEADSRWVRVADGIGMLLMVFFGFIMRGYSVYCVLCFLALAAVYRGMVALWQKRNWKKKKWKKTAVKAMAIVAASVVLVLGARTVSLALKAQDPRTVQYDAYNDYRIAYQDFPSASYDEYESLYQSIGWDEDLYSAMKGLLYLDPRINTDSLMQLTEGFEENGQAETRTVRVALQTIKNLVQTSETAKLLLVGVALLFGSGMLCWLTSPKKKQRFPALFCLFCAFGGCMVMVLYLAWQGRFPLRTLQTVAIPAGVVLAMMLPSMQNRFRQVGKLVENTVLAALVLLAGLQVYQTANNLEDLMTPATKTSVTMEQAYAFEEYAMEHPENLYVYDFTVATVMRDPLRVYPDQKPYNCIIAGGSYTFSALYYDQLAAMGRDELYWDTMCEDNVYFVTDITEKESYIKRVQKNASRMLAQTVTYELVDQVGNVGIYKLSAE